MTPWKFKAPYHWYFKRAKLVFGVSKVICQEYTNRTGVNVTYLPPLIPFSIASEDKKDLRKEYGFNTDENIFLSVGSLKKLKKPMAVVLAAESLGINFLSKHNIRFVFAGDGPLKIEMKSFIKQHKLSKFVSLLGNVPREKVHEVYKLSDSYIISSDFEGTPISMLEAMANKLLIIGSDVQGINNILSQDGMGFLFDNANVQQLASIIEKVVSENLQSKKDNAQHFYLMHFSHEKILKQIKDVL